MLYLRRNLFDQGVRIKSNHVILLQSGSYGVDSMEVHQTHEDSVLRLQILSGKSVGHRASPREHSSSSGFCEARHHIRKRIVAQDREYHAREYRHFEEQQRTCTFPEKSIVYYFIDTRVYKSMHLHQS